MTEATLNHAVKRLLTGPGCRVTRIETTTVSGVPDIYYNLHGQTGWLENKFLRTWPKRAKTIVRLPHYTPQQKARLREEGETGARAWLLLRAGDDHLLFDWRAAQAVGHLTKAQLFKVARCVWEGPLTRAPLVWALTNGN
jgi:hypothetical protein